MNISHKNIINSNKMFPQLFCNGANSAESFYCGHIGPSMNPTLTAQDLLEIKPFNNERPQVGDVIFFQSPEHDHFVVHRIVSIGANGIQTRGDNNCYIDPELLKQDDLLGRVIAAHRGISLRKIANGYIGRVTGGICHLRRLARIQAVRFLGPVYRSFCTGGFLHWLIPFRLQPQIASFKKGRNVSHKLLLGKKVIGAFDEALFRWEIRHPYRLFIDETSLPTRK